jgi:3',5'-cyclic AMP phosphodiesterase CpdA
VSVIAHLTDVHLIEPDARRSGGFGAAARRGFLNLGRPIDEGARRISFAAALAHATALGFDHLVVTGDLTEEGTIEQFEAVAAVLDAAGLDAARVTLVPGNHDVYASADAWGDALAGPLRPYARTSAPGAVVELGDAVIAPVSTARAQRWWRSAGEVSSPERRSIGLAVQTASRRGVAAVIAQHHPPTRVHRAAWHWFDGLLDHAAMRPVLRAVESTYVLHGHLHERRDDRFEGEASAHIFGAAAVMVEQGGALRRYRVEGGALAPVESA